ncbi:MAG: hypothetical protein ABEI77_08850 [Halorientalis sp.]
MSRTVSPRTYRRLDRGAKLVGVVAVAIGLQDPTSSLAPWLVVCGIALGVSTVFLDVASDYQ